MGGLSRGGPALSVVIPVLNEGLTIGEQVARTRATLDSWPGGFEIVIVDDGSAPSERAILRAVASTSDDVRVVELVRNQGQVVALYGGLCEARGSIVVTMDGDLQDLPEQIPTLVAALASGAQVATAHRDALHGAVWRRWGSRLATRWAGHLVRVRLSDFGGQYNAYRREVVDGMVANWRPRSPLLPLACALGFSIVEVPVHSAPRSAGRSRHGLGMKLGIVADLTVAFAGPVTLCLVGGAAATVAVLAGWSFAGVLRSGTGALQRRIALGVVSASVALGAASLPVGLAVRSVERGRRGPYVVRRH